MGAGQEKKASKDKALKGKSNSVDTPENLTTASSPRPKDKGKEKLEDKDLWSDLKKDSAYPSASYRRLRPERDEIAIERERSEVLMPIELTVGKKEQHLTKRTPGIFHVGRRENIDDFLKVAFAPNIVSIMKQRFIGLDASNTDISTEGLKALPHTFKLINLENCQHITDESLVVLQQFEELEDINLNGCSVTEKGFNTLKALKKLKINFQEEYTPSKSFLKQKEPSSSLDSNLSGLEAGD